jgi:hypothetical protein
MGTLRRIFGAIRTLLRGEADDRDFDDEVRFHMEREIELRMRQGMDATTARTAALRSFGGVERFREAARDERGGQAMVRTYLVSETGKVYTMLAHSAGRFD